MRERRLPARSPQSASRTGLFGLAGPGDRGRHHHVFLPLLIIIFLGAPLLAREHERRTLFWPGARTSARSALAVNQFRAARRPDRDDDSGDLRAPGADHVVDEVGTRPGNCLPVLAAPGSSSPACCRWRLRTVASSSPWCGAERRVPAAALPAIFAALTRYIARPLPFVVWQLSVLMTPADSPGPRPAATGFSPPLSTNILVVHHGMNTIFNIVRPPP